MLHRRSPSATPPPAAQLPPLEVENLLWEILLRLPPLPSSLPRASLVCKRWLGVVSDPGFFRSFREHHRKPPLLGYFFFHGRGADFVPTLDPPDRIPAARFSLPPQSHCEQFWFFRGCRHGLCLFIDFARSEAVVCDPITSHQRRIALPPEFIGDKDGALVQNGGVLCAAGNGHVHGDCSLSPFKLVLLYNDRNASSVSACLYESESGVWGSIVSENSARCDWLHNAQHPCWEIHFVGVLKEENGLGLAVLKRSLLESLIIEIWGRKVDSYGTPSCSQLLCILGLMRRLVRFFFLWVLMSSRSTLRCCTSEIFLQDSPRPITPATIIPTEIFIPQQWIAIMAPRGRPAAERPLKTIKVKLRVEAEGRVFDYSVVLHCSQGRHVVSA